MPLYPTEKGTQVSLPSVGQKISEQSVIKAQIHVVLFTLKTVFKVQVPDWLGFSLIVPVEHSHTGWEKSNTSSQSVYMIKQSEMSCVVSTLLSSHRLGASPWQPGLIQVIDPGCHSTRKTDDILWQNRSTAVRSSKYFSKSYLIIYLVIFHFCWSSALHLAIIGQTILSKLNKTKVSFIRAARGHETGSWAAVLTPLNTHLKPTI